MISDCEGVYRTLIVEDEPAARAGLRGLVDRDRSCTVVGECKDGREAVLAIAELWPDIVLLDVEMPELDAFGVIDALPPEHLPAVLLITAFDRYAVRAFEQAVVDYVVKPFDDDRFSAALERAKQARRTRTLSQIGARVAALSRTLGEVAQDGPTPAASPLLERLVVKEAERSVLLSVDEIEWIEANDYCVKVHAAGRAYILRATVQSLEARLDPSRFFRVHRSALVNLDRVREFRPSFKGEHIVVLHNGMRLRLPRSRREALEARLLQRI